jgi:hypothetical protein
MELLWQVAAAKGMGRLASYLVGFEYRLMGALSWGH